MIIYQQDVDARFDITVLESIVEQYHVDVLLFLLSFVGCQQFDAVASVLIDSHDDILKLLLHLEGFVAYLRHRGLLVGHDESFAFAFISSA